MATEARREYTNHPADVQDILFNLRSADNDTFVSCNVTVDPAGSLTSPSSVINGAACQMFLSGGVDGTDYTVTTRLVTTNGRTRNPQVIIKVRA